MKLLANLRSSEQGAAFLLALGFMMLAVPLLVGALSLGSTLSMDAAKKTNLLLSQYGAIGGIQYADYRLMYDANYTQTLTQGVEDITTIILNGESVEVGVTMLAEPVLSDPDPVEADDQRKLHVHKVVDPTTGPANQSFTMEYYVHITNKDAQPVSINKIFDLLPAGFSYVPGSTDGITISDPAITPNQGPYNDQDELRWDLGVPYQLISGDMAEHHFSAQANVGDGTYCNEAWAEPGGQHTMSGLDAILSVGTPPDGSCRGEWIKVGKEAAPEQVQSGEPTTITYTITLDNIGTEIMSVTRIRDMLPDTFEYVNGSTTGMTTDDPGTSQGGERLDWTFNPSYEIPPGSQAVLFFDASVTPDAGDHYNQVWVFTEERSISFYTWPTALVQAVGVFDISAVAPKSQAHAQTWLGTSGYVVEKLVIEH